MAEAVAAAAAAERRKEKERNESCRACPAECGVPGRKKVKVTR
jgi:hypothetical protein